MCETLHNFNKLSHLDISRNLSSEQDSDDLSDLLINETVLEMLALLPSLSSLDISGAIGLPLSSIDCFDPPRKKMAFLGLLKTSLSAVSDIPACEVNFKCLFY